MASPPSNRPTPGGSWPASAAPPRASPSSGQASTASRFPCPTTAATLPCPPSRCARSPTWPPPCGRSRRVLKPGGTFHFLEHGLAPDELVRRWQYRLEPIEKRLFGGCHLTRPIADLVTGAGFTITELDVFYERGAPKPVGAASLGVAIAF